MIDLGEYRNEWNRLAAEAISGKTSNLEIISSLLLMSNTLINELTYQNIRDDTLRSTKKPEYTIGIAGDGTAILKDGELITIEEVLEELNS